ncbi:hypothetical protein F5Y13DRAFT_152793 [Hypoxylon sp. FL1857]|nr:hypothetical protein F5Y13DRAFT_152793 [Hypoxylon sp. FL1857]
MEVSNHLPQEGVIMDAGNCSADVIVPGPPRKSSLTNNFSYPRPDGHLCRHESSDSRSSLMSNGSLPGMTDSSDSETSFEEDSNYNTSASELWDSFWPDSTIAPGEQYPVLLRASQTPNYFTKSFSKRKSEEVDDTITISKLEHHSKKALNSQCETPVPQLSPPRPSTRNGSPTYSVYPKIEPTSPLRIPLPPRTSSLNTVPLSPPRRQALKLAKSTVNLKASKSSHSLRPQHAIPPVSKMPLLPVSASSVPVSPAYPPPPPPQTLRPAASVFNLRDRNNSLSQAQHNTTAPLSPLSREVPMLEPQQPPQPQAERYISVFEVDSDAESYMESNSFTKRIARGFHKKSASEKRSTSGRRASDGSDLQVSEKEKGKESPSRKRGGSLGRILGLRSR